MQSKLAPLLVCGGKWVQWKVLLISETWKPQQTAIFPYACNWKLEHHRERACSLLVEEVQRYSWDIGISSIESRISSTVELDKRWKFLLGVRPTKLVPAGVWEPVTHITGKLCWMDPTRRKCVHVPFEIVRAFPVFHTGTRPKPNLHCIRCQAKFLTPRHVRTHRVIFFISNTLRKLMIRVVATRQEMYKNLVG